MMQPIIMTWAGVQYTIPASRAFKIGAKIEKIVTLGEIAAWGNNIPFFQVSSCFGEMLRFAGASVTDDDMFSEMKAGLRAGDASAGTAVQAVTALTECLMGGAPAAPATSMDDAKTSAS